MVTPLKTQFWHHYFGPCWTLEAFLGRFFGKCPFGGGDQKKVWFLHFFVKIEKISKFGLFPITYYIYDRFRHVQF